MKCISSPALDDVQILTFIEGEADDVIAAHIKECPFCREKADRWTRLQKGLQKQLYRVSCPTSMELGECTTSVGRGSASPGMSALPARGGRIGGSSARTSPANEAA
jgi:hypothetical protein